MHILIWRCTGAESANKVKDINHNVPVNYSVHVSMGGYEYWATVAVGQTIQI